MTTVHFVVPEGIDDPARPSGGNSYDRHLSRGLAAAGWSVHEHAGTEPLAAIPDGAVVLVDALVAADDPASVVAHAQRLRLAVLMHMPIGDEREGAVLRAAAAVVTTSDWARSRVIELHQLPAERVRVATPGVEPAPLATGTENGAALLCVAAVIPGKGHDVLLDALATIADLQWNCTCVGSVERDPEFVARLPSGLATFAGPRTGAELDRCYAAADLLVLPSRAEAYGMVITEALARGLPVIATDVGGVSEALGGGGMLVAPSDAAALGDALREWLTGADFRARLRRSARERRESLAPWSTTTALVADVLGGLS